MAIIWKFAFHFEITLYILIITLLLIYPVLSIDFDTFISISSSMHIVRGFEKSSIQEISGDKALAIKSSAATTQSSEANERRYISKW